ncbi:paraquat-inducible protein A [Psychromonas sp. CNPT3]|uniref:paraquat-inducible protein A n=1 Tax=Psychromonas sp. CNPT3 TaxID=314282 RepID=UPI00006E48CA|nr:paraquat-inducible protein A [Psychromonas sp. CNPT3]AGH80970.1 paraquat-inducible protein A [Psychromonas sp. CNPT3]
MSETAKAGKTGLQQGIQLCRVCFKNSNQKQHPDICPNCSNPISLRKKNSLQKTWALLLTAVMFLIPANIYPITYLLKNSTLYPDTIFSGILSLIDSDMKIIACIVFIASIVVPILKIIGLAAITIAVHFKYKLDPKKQFIAFSFIEWVGKWSVLDLFVISLMVAVFDKGNLLSVYPGIAASSFTLVVLCTLLAANSFDTRLIWDAQNNE